MRWPDFMRETIACARERPVWGVAYLAALMLPLMLIFARAGIEICAAVIGLLFLWNSMRTRQWGWLHDPFIITCLAAWAWLSLVVTPLALNPEHSAKTALLWIRLPLLFAALRYWVLVPRFARSSLAVMLLVILALVMLDTLWQFVQGVSLSGHIRMENGRLSGPFSDPKVGVFIGRFILPAFALGAAAVLAARSRPRWLAGAATMLALVLVTIMLSGERAALLTTMLAAGVAAALAMIRRKQWRLPIMLAALALLLVLAALVATSGWVQERGALALDKMLHYPQSDYGQLFIAAYDMALVHPLHGVGLGGFRDVCPDLYYEGKIFHGLHPHHAFMEWFAESGLPGLALFITMIGFMLREAMRHYRAAEGMDFIVPALLLGIIAQHFFPLTGMQSFFTNWAAMLLWYTIGIAFAALPSAARRG